MTTEIKENHDPEAPKDIALKLRRQDKIIVFPIDLSLSNTEKVNAEQLQWLNFYESPKKLTLSNSGETVMVRGLWPNRRLRPTLVGGPLDGPYIFSQAHFHWDSQSHIHSKHTINGKGNKLEMHALFYKSTYQNQIEAQEKEDGIVIVVYFFKLEQESSLKWMTDQLNDVTTPKTNTSLPPAPLCALMTPFIGDYLAYWSALACSCHHVLWLLSRKPLRITQDELVKFSKVQNHPKENINIKSTGSQNTKTASTVYQINSTSETAELLFPDAADPPCRIAALPNKITIAVDYPEIIKPNNTAVNSSGGGNIQEPQPQSQTPEVLANTDRKNKTPSEYHTCRVCKKLVAHSKSSNKLVAKLSKKRVGVPKKSTLECEKNPGVGKIKLKIKREKKRIEDELLKKKNEEARRELEKERIEIKLIKKTLDSELKRLHTQAHKINETPNNNVGNEEKSVQKRVRTPIQKSVLTSRPKSVMVEKNKIVDKENNGNLVQDEQKTETEANGDQGKVKGNHGVKNKEPPKSKLPVRKFTPWKPKEGLKSSLTPYFSNAKPWSPSEKKQETPCTKETVSKPAPKSAKRMNVNRSKTPQQQGLKGCGDQNMPGPKKIYKEPIGFFVRM